MSAESGPSGAGIGTSGFISSTSGVGEMGGSIGGVEGLGTSFSIGPISSISESTSSLANTTMAPKPMAATPSFEGFTPFVSSPQDISFDTPYHGDLSFLNPTIDLSPKNLAVIDNSATEVMNETDSFISRLLADLADEGEDPFSYNTTLSDTENTHDSLHLSEQVDTASIEMQIDNEVTKDLELAESILNLAVEPEVAVNDLSTVDMQPEESTNHVADAQIDEIRAELDAMIYPVNESLQNPDSEAIEDSISTDFAGNTEPIASMPQSNAYINDLTSESAIITAGDFLIESEEIAETQAKANNQNQENGTEVADQQAEDALQNDNDEADIATLLREEGVDVTEEEIRQGKRIIEEMKAIDIDATTATQTVTEALAEPTYTLETIGEEGDIKKVKVEKIAQEIHMETLVPVVDEEANNKRKEIALTAVDETVSTVKELFSEKEIAVNENQIWISGKHIAEELLKNEVLSGILNDGPDGSNEDLARRLGGQWVTLYNASSTIDNDIRNSTAVEYGYRNPVTPKEVHKVTNGPDVGIIRASRV